MLEARAVYTWRRQRWGVRADGGLGVQEVGKGAPTQSEWHAGLAVTRGWGANSELALVGSFTNSGQLDGDRDGGGVRVLDGGGEGEAGALGLLR